MSYKTKICPDCKSICSENAVTCECGHRFRDGDDNVTDREAAAKRRNFITTALVAALIVIFTVLTIAYGFRVLLYAVGASLVLVILAVLIYKIKSRIDRKRLG